MIGIICALKIEVEGLKALMEEAVATHKAGLEFVSGKIFDKDVVLLITDSNDKVHGHEDISWLYDTDFAPLTSDKIKNIYIGGSRCYDLAQCLEIKGLDTSKFTLFEDYCITKTTR